jgi:diguanylate cyclase (GGDEF)-like protein
MPVTDSEAQLPATGQLITADWLTPDRLQTLQKVLALRFSVDPGVPPTAAEAEPLSVPGWSQPASLQRGAEVHSLRWTLQDWVQAPVASVSLSWPREMRAQTSLVLRGAQGVVLGLALMLALVLALVIDWRLVRRLRRLQGHLRRLREDERWDQRLPVDGHDEVAQLAQEGNHLLARIDDQVQRLGALSQTDPLTGLGNRRAFDPALDAAVGRCRRNRQPLALAMIDVDHFKRFNDRHGHAAGDLALQALAQGLREVLRRAGDQTARWGGEEFVLLMEGTDAEVARGRVALLQQWLASQPHGPDQALAQAMTVSVGLAMLRAGELPEALMARADAALYRAKDAGRDRVELDL